MQLCSANIAESINLSAWIKGSSGVAFERRVMLEKPFIALEHVVPIEDRQSGDLDPPTNPTFLRRIERQRRRDFAAIDEFGQDGLAISSNERARGISVVTLCVPKTLSVLMT